jgi:hypothetical protein
VSEHPVSLTPQTASLNSNLPSPACHQNIISLENTPKCTTSESSLHILGQPFAKYALVTASFQRLLRLLNLPDVRSQSSLTEFGSPINAIVAIIFIGATRVIMTGIVGTDRITCRVQALTRGAIAYVINLSHNHASIEWGSIDPINLHIYHSLPVDAMHWSFLMTC